MSGANEHAYRLPGTLYLSIYGTRQPTSISRW